MLQTKIERVKSLTSKKRLLAEELQSLKTIQLPIIEQAIDETYKATYQPNEALLTQDTEVYSNKSIKLETIKKERFQNERLAKAMRKNIYMLEDELTNLKLEISSTMHDIWKDKYNQLVAALPALPTETQLLLDKIVSCKFSLCEGWGYGWGYGSPLSDLHGKPTQQNIADAKALLLSEMGI